MKEIWLGHCHLRAQSAERRRWIGDAPEVTCQLLLRAGSEADFHDGLRRGLDHWAMIWLR